MSVPASRAASAADPRPVAARPSPTAATSSIAAAERLIAERGFLAVRLEDIGAAAGVSGPAIYRHFPNKEALLVELLVGISTRLLAGAAAVVADAPDPAAALDGLIDFHLDFALGESDLIRIQDRDLAHLPEPAKRQVRKAQRQYVEIWVDVLRRLNRAGDEDRCAADGARRVRPAELDPAQRQARHSQFGRPRNGFRVAGDLAGDDDRGPVLGRPKRRLGASQR